MTFKKGHVMPDAVKAKISDGLRSAYANGKRNRRRGPPSPELRIKLMANLVRARSAVQKYKPGDRYICKRYGYAMVYLPGYYNGSKHFVPEHKLVAEKALGRKLKRGEIVHHINGNQSDNRNSNLLICTQKYHAELHNRMSFLYQREHFA